MGKKDAIVLVSEKMEEATPSTPSPAITIIPEAPDLSPEYFHRSFLQKFIANQQIYTLLKDMKRGGSLIHLPKDIGMVTHPLAKILRIIFVDQRITDKYFEDRHTVFRVNQNSPQNEINSDRNNLRKSFTKNESTYSSFEKILSILEMHVVDTVAVIRNAQGEVFMYRKNKDFQNAPYPVVTVEDIYNMDDTYPHNTTPIYSAKTIYNSTHPMAMFIHMFCVHQKISMEQFYFTFNEYYQRLGYTSNRINAHRNNSVRQYFISSPTFKAWEKFNTVMGATLLDFGVVVRHKDGVVCTYMVSDAKRVMEANAYLNEYGDSTEEDS